MERVSGHPDDGPQEEEQKKGATSSVSLVRWLEDKVMKRDPTMLNDPKWKARTLWHEFMRITQVTLLYFTQTRLSRHQITIGPK